MTKYIERDKAVKLIFLAADTGRAAKALSLLGKESVADVVEVVRCKDCESAYGEDIFNSIRWCNANGIYVGLDDFCSYGARKGDSE